MKKTKKESKKDIPRRVIYYRDEQNDEFSSAEIKSKRIDGAYRYERDGFWGRLAHLFWYRIVAVPLAWCYLKLWFGHRIVGGECLKNAETGGYCLYGNHTQATADALIPTFLTRRRDAYVIVHPNNVSMPLLGRITPYLGALPLPDDLDATRNFSRAVAHKLESGHALVVYPEAHIWPYYTGIRRFGDNAFLYPVKHGTPTYCFTNTYQRRRFCKRPRLVTYVDGPFLPPADLSAREARRTLRDEVYKTMEARSHASNQVWISYQKAEEKEENA